MTRILMVCLGNICRSPIAQAVGEHLAQQAGLSQQFQFDSAGTHAARSAGRPDERARTALERKGYKMGRHRVRGMLELDFECFDLILAMDRSNLADLRHKCPAEHAHKLRLFLDFAPGLEGQEVPDPYYGSAQGFDRVLELCEAGAHGLLARVQAQPRLNN